jgi:hypothetical protein
LESVNIKSDKLIHFLWILALSNSKC